MMSPKKRLPVLYIVTPCYNEQDVLPETYSIFTDKLETLIRKKKINEDSRVLFVNDGSEDETWNIIKDLSKKYRLVEGISLSRNRGHQNALLAGLLEAKDRCDITVTMDVDGQHDINAVDEMLAKYLEGYEIVYGIRNQRSGDSFLKKLFSEGYYRIINMLGGEIIVNHADFRLVSSRVLNEFKDFQEVNIFLRGLFPLVGFKHCTVHYDQFDRVAGSSHYTLKKMLTLAIDGITSLSIKPVRLIFVFGIMVSMISFIFLIVNLISYNAIWAAASLLSVLFGLLFISVGIVGEYVGKTYMETKHRPRYIISERTFK